MYLNQIVSHKTKIEDALNAYGEYTYKEEKIKARKQYKSQEVLDKEGKVHRSTYEVYTNTPIELDDLIDGRLVIMAEGYVNLGGKTILYRSLTV